jgi:hypothetical protein
MAVGPICALAAMVQQGAIADHKARQAGFFPDLGVKALTTRLAYWANRVVSGDCVGARRFEPPTSRSRTKTNNFAPLTTGLGDLSSLVSSQGA